MMEEATLRRTTEASEPSNKAATMAASKASFGPWMVAQQNRRRAERMMKGNIEISSIDTETNLNGGDHGRHTDVTRSRGNGSGAMDTGSRFTVLDS